VIFTILTAVSPVLSYALAAIVYVYFLVGTFQVHPYGAETSVQSSLPFTENSTLDTALLSDATAVIVTVLL
jgi:hypothetical protein